MTSLQISALGSPEIRVNNTRVTVKPKKALALLIYLAAAEYAPTRDQLATLLWPESGQRTARAALRRRLSELAHSIGEPWLEVEGDTVSLADVDGLSYDVRRFQDGLAHCVDHGHGADKVCSACRLPLETAVQVYRDDFLAGFTLAGCAEFDDWQFFQAESLRQALGSALERLVTLHVTQGNPTGAIPHARRWIALDPLNELAHRALMRVYAVSGQRSAAVRQYELCVQTLDAELGALPDAETSDLYQVIRSERAASVAVQGNVLSGAKILPHSEEEPAAGARAHGPAETEDEVRMATILALDADATDEAEWGSRPDEISANIAAFLQDAISELGRYEANALHVHDSGLQAAFGLPIVHEDDAERALNAVWALQQKATGTELCVTAGVATGMVYVSRGQDDGQASVTGPSVRLAARLHGLARRGQVLVDGSTHYQTEQAFRLASRILGRQGQREPMIAYEVVRPRRHAVKSRGIGSLRAPLIGRDDEMVKLQIALEKATNGVGQLVTIVGEAGLGKSRLVSELQETLGDAQRCDQVLWLEGRCLEMMQAVPYWPFVDILQTSFGWMPSTPETERAQQVTFALDELRCQGRLTDEQLNVMGPILGRLLSFRYGNEWDERLQNARPEQIRHQTFETLRLYAAAIAQRRPLVLILEDLHWADTLSLDLVGYLLDELAEQPILLMCVYRPEAALEQDKLATVALRKCPAAYTELRLRELTPDSSRALVEAILHVEGLTPETRDRILDTCQGNPFFLEEVIHDLIEDGLIYQDGDVWRAREEVESTLVPSRVQGVILARYDRLAPAHKVAAQHAAVIGRLFSEQVLASALAQELDLDEALDALEARAFIYPDRTVPETVYSFRHVLAQEAVYRTIPGRRRAALHECVGGALEVVYGENLDEVVDQLAHHYERSNAGVKAVEYLLRAGDKAAKAYLTDEAALHYQRALKRIEELEEDGRAHAWRFHAWSELGKTLMRSSQYDEAENYLRQAIAYGKEQALPVKEVVRLHWWLGDLLMNWNVRYDETVQTGLDGLAMLPEEEQESVEAAMMLGIIAYGHFFLGDEDRFHATAARLANLLPELQYREEFRVCYGCIVESCFFRRDVEGLTYWTKQMGERARRHEDQWTAAASYENEAYVRHYFVGDSTSAMALMQTALKLRQCVGDGRRANWVEVAVGEILDDLGDSAKAQDTYHSALPAVRDLNAERLSDVLLKLASVCMAQGKLKEARDVLREAQQEMIRLKENPCEAMVLLGFISLSCGDRPDAVKCFAEALHALDNPDTLPHSRRKWRLMTHSFFANALYGMECALDDAYAFHAFCRDFRESHPATEHAVFQHWYLTSAELGLPDADVANDRFANALGSEWDWVDPNGGCRFEVQNGLTLWSRAVRDLWYPLVNAPRIVRPVAGDFAAQVRCDPASADRPGIGGLLLWQDVHSYLHFCIGVRAQDEMSLEGSIDNRDVTIGRGRLVEEPVTLRMERIGERVRALCSADGETWYSVGEVDFAPTEDEDIGLVAIGFPDRTIYQAPYPDGTAIRFTDFCLWN